ncbi:MAG: PASTA domain-containing protein [Lachnospiraceae bacterium]|nr:PASTA domain-containing protein [Lachnospiraceae bacterium]
MNQICGNCFQNYDGDVGICPHCHYDNRSERQGTNCLDQGSMLAGRYLIGRVLGVGGFGITYLAFDKILAQIVAIKEYLPGEFSTRIPTQALVTVYTGEKEEQFLAGQKRFMEEARKLARFQNHEGIVQIYDCFELNNTSYIAMEYLKGKTIQALINEKGKFEVDAAVEIIIQVLTALEDVHKIGILHRDIAPDNIIITDDNKVKLCDFGAARYATTSHSKSLSVVIKQGYAPVEQYRSKGDQGPWTDVYGTAATLYKMITGVTPEDSMERYVKDELVLPSKMGIKIRKNTENAIMNGLNIQIEGRYKSAGEFARALSSKTVKLQTTKVKAVDVGKMPIVAKVGIAVGILAVASILVLFKTGYFDKDVQTWGSSQLAEGQYRVPNIINMGLIEAQAAVEESHLSFVIVDKEYSDEIPKDKVLGQSINAGSVANEGESIEVTVSGGTKKDEILDNMKEDETLMPDVQYKSEEEATKTLEAAGLKVNISYEESETVEEGKVISQDVEADQVVKKEKEITLLVSKKPEVKKEEVKKETKKNTKKTTVTTSEAPAATPDPQPAPTPQPDPQPQPQQSAPADDGNWQTNFDLAW